MHCNELVVPCFGKSLKEILNGAQSVLQQRISNEEIRQVYYESITIENKGYRFVELVEYCEAQSANVNKNIRCLGRSVALCKATLAPTTAALTRVY